MENARNAFLARFFLCRQKKRLVFSNETKMPSENAIQSGGPRFITLAIGLRDPQKEREVTLLWANTAFSTRAHRHRQPPCSTGCFASPTLGFPTPPFSTESPNLQLITIFPCEQVHQMNFAR
jgi:hypothetical protein